MIWVSRSSRPAEPISVVRRVRILYYCPQYYMRHGGRSHARGFFHALKTLPTVSACFLYPRSEPDDPPQHASPKQASREKFWFLPPTARGLMQFFKPRPGLSKKLISEINTNHCDAIVIRTGSTRPSLRMIKRTCPGTVVCLEINSAVFDESFHRLPFRPLLQKLEVMRFKQADAIVVVSSYLKDYLEQRGVPSRKDTG